MVAVAAEYQRRMAAEVEQRWDEAIERYVSISDDYRELAAENVSGIRSEGRAWVNTCRGQDLMEDIEAERERMKGDAEAPRYLEVRRPYRVQRRIIADVAAWASVEFGKPVSPGLVEAACEVRKSILDDV